MSMEPSKQRFEAVGTAIVALVVVMGGQMVRVLIPLVGWYLRDVKSVGTLDLIPFALAPFAASLLLPLMVRVVGARPALRFSVGSLAAARLENQISTRLSKRGFMVSSTVKTPTPSSSTLSP